MQRVIKHHSLILFALLFSVLSGCASTGGQKGGDFEVYEVYHDGRINVFYDRKLYQEYLAMHETPFRLTRIGAGPKGETIVFGLTKEDKKMKSEIPVISLYDGKMEAPKNFYGEMRRHGRIYVFSSWEDMKPVREYGHPNFFFTEIGQGPKGETVVYVVNERNKKHLPKDLVKKFKSMNK